MKLALAIWNERIAPVFDVAGHVLLVEAEEGRILKEVSGTLPSASPLEKLIYLASLDVKVLLCGAISRIVQFHAAAYGIEVHPFVSGDAHAVLRAWLSGEHGLVEFAMPGCGKRRFRRCGRQCGGKGARSGPDRRA